jgi:hypothetical protein
LGEVRSRKKRRDLQDSETGLTKREWFPFLPFVSFITPFTLRLLTFFLLKCLKEISRAEVEKTEEELANEDLSKVTLLDEVKGQLFQLRQCLNLQERMKSFIEINRAVFKVQTEAVRLQLNIAGTSGSRIKALTTSSARNSPLRSKLSVQITLNEMDC